MKLKTVGCDICGLVQTNPRPSEEGLTLFYREDYRKFYQDVIRPSKKYIYDMNKRERLIATTHYLSHLSNSIKSLSILDIGCSEGALFSVMREKGFTGSFYGVEPNSEFARYATETTNATVYSSLYEVRETVDLVVLNHVFEHLLNPYDSLRSIWKRMKPNAYLYIDVPDADEYKSLNDIHIAHMFHFTETTLPYLVEKVGFEIIKCEKYAPTSHPKSIRLVARRLDFININSKIPTPVGEGKSWVAVKKLSVFEKRLRSMVKKVPFAKSIYFGIRNVSK